MNSEDFQSFIGFIALSLAVCLAVLLVTFTTIFIIPVSIAGVICYFIYKSHQKSPIEQIEALRIQVEELEEKTEIDYRDAIYDKIGQDIYLDEAIGAIIEWEGRSEVPQFPKTDDPITIARYQDQAAAYINNHADNTFSEALITAVEPFIVHTPRGMFSGSRPIKLEEVDDLYWRFNHPQYFKRLRSQLERNLESKPKEAWGYIKHTPFEFIAKRPMRVNINYPFEHLHCLGGTGAGKTQLLQYMISKRLDEDCTVIVIDNQRQMIPKLATLGVDMQYLSPHYPLALNLFDMQRGSTTAPLLRYVLSGLMEAPLTAKQAILFQFAVDLMLKTNGNISTFHQLLKSNSDEDFDFSGLDETGQKFFKEEFYRSGRDGYKETRDQIGWRVWTLLTNPTLRNMFAATENRCKLELDRKLILIDTDIDLLHDYSGLFGRFFIAQLLQLAQHRFEGDHRPIYVFIDECYYYLDDNVTSMLETARKAKIGLTLAHQYLAQISDSTVGSALMALTSTKLAAQLPNPTDQAMMARAMRTTPDYIADQPELHFALWQKGEDVVSIEVPVGVIEDMEQHPVPDDLMIERYGRPPEEPEPPAPPPQEPPEVQIVEEEGDF